MQPMLWSEDVKVSKDQMLLISVLLVRSAGWSVEVRSGCILRKDCGELKGCICAK